MKALFAIESLMLVSVYLLSRKKYGKLLGLPEAKAYSLYFLLPLGLYLLDISKYKYNNRYDKKVSKLLTYLYGDKLIVEHIKLFYSYKLTVMLSSLYLLSLFGAGAVRADSTYIMLTLILPAAMFYFLDRELENRLKKKQDSIRADFPDMVSKLVLLVNAGMTMNRAWEKICTETRKDSPLYRELKTTYQQIQGGKPEGEAYEEFARRCKVREISKFVAVVIQNMKKGSGDLVPLLRLQSEECWELRKSRAKQLGEEASAKLLIPMMIMFIGILIIVVLPAVLQINNL